MIYTGYLSFLTSLFIIHRVSGLTIRNAQDLIITSRDSSSNAVDDALPGNDPYRLHLPTNALDLAVLYNALNVIEWMVRLGVYEPNEYHERVDQITPGYRLARLIMEGTTPDSGGKFQIGPARESLAKGYDYMNEHQYFRELYVEYTVNDKPLYNVTFLRHQKEFRQANNETTLLGFPEVNSDGSDMLVNATNSTPRVWGAASAAENVTYDFEWSTADRPWDPIYTIFVALKGIPPGNPSGIAEAKTFDASLVGCELQVEQADGQPRALTKGELLHALWALTSSYVPTFRMTRPGGTRMKILDKESQRLIARIELRSKSRTVSEVSAGNSGVLVS